MDVLDYSDIAFEVHGPIARISFNRPHARNAQSRRLLDEMDDAFARAELDPAIRAVILSGKGPHFSAGHDLKEAQKLRGNATVEERWEYEEQRFYKYCLRVLDYPKPTIAEVRGGCIAAAFMLANVCDLIVASEDAFFSDAVTHTFAVNGLEVLIHPWVLGMRKTKEFLFTGSNMTAAEALAAGMVNRVVPGDRLEAETMALGKRIALAEPFALRLLKRSLNRTQEVQGLRVALNAHFDTHQLSHVTEEFKTKVADGLSSRIVANKQVIGS